jgi:hypothetical protein
MNWFQRVLNNPNAHLVASIVAGAASIAFPPAAGVLQIIAGAFAGTALVLPEQPQHVVLPQPVSPIVPAAPVPAIPGSMHMADWMALLQQSLDAFKAAQNPPAAPVPPAPKT